MDAIIRALAIYGFLLVVFRLSGKRSLSQITTFDFVLLLIIAEVTQQALLSNDFSLTNSFILILSLVTIDIFMSLVKRWKPVVAKWLDGAPVVVFENGKLKEEAAKKERISVDDILEAARSSHGIQNISQVKHAVLEKSGGITVIPR